MKHKTNGTILAIAGVCALSLLSPSAMAASSATASLQSMIQANSERQLATEVHKYTQVASLAGSKQDELSVRKDDAVRLYRKWYDLKTTVSGRHNPSAQDYREVASAAQAYSDAYKAFVDLQKGILSENGAPRAGVAKKIVALQ
jgi:hypothetical protein